MDYAKYIREFRKQPTKKLIEDYHGYNDEFRRYARQEFVKRNVPENKLPYKKRESNKPTSAMIEAVEKHENKVNPRNTYDPWGTEQAIKKLGFGW